MPCRAAPGLVAALAVASLGRAEPPTVEQVEREYSKYVGKTVVFDGCRAAAADDATLTRRALAVTSPGGTVYAGPPGPTSVGFAVAQTDAPTVLAGLVPGRAVHARLTCDLTTDPAGRRVALVRKLQVTPVPLAGHTAAVAGVTFLKNGQVATAGGTDQTVRVWQPDSGRQLAALSVDGIAMCVAGSSDGAWLAAGAASPAGGDLTGEVLVWSAADRTLSWADRGLAAAGAVALGFSPDGQTLAVGGRTTKVLMFPVHGKRTVTPFEHLNVAAGVAFAPDGKHLAVAGSRARPLALLDDLPDGWIPTDPPNTTKPGAAEVKVWTLADKTGTALPKTNETRFYALTYSPDGTQLAAAGGDGLVWRWDVAAKHFLPPLKVGTCAVLSLAYSPDGKLLATGDTERDVKLWDVATGGLKLAIIDHSAAVRGVSFSPDGRFVAAAGGPTPLVWDVGYLLAVGKPVVKAAIPAPPATPVAAAPTTASAPPPSPPTVTVPPPAAVVGPEAPLPPPPLGPFWGFVREVKTKWELVVFLCMMLAGSAAWARSLLGKVKPRPAPTAPPVDPPPMA